MRICASRPQNLLEVVHDLFEEQTSLEKVTLKIMQRAQRLLKCERAAVLLLDENADGVKFSKLFELTIPAHSNNHMRYSNLRCVKDRYLSPICKKTVSIFFQWWYFENLILVSVQLINDFPTILGNRKLLLYL